MKVPFFFYEANWQVNLVALSEIIVPLYEIGATTRFLLSEHFDIGAAYAQYGSL